MPGYIILEQQKGRSETFPCFSFKTWVKNAKSVHLMVLEIWKKHGDQVRLAMLWINNWPAPNVSGFIAQLVEHHTGITRSWVQTPLKSWIFFQASLRNCINCVHCDNHFFFKFSFHFRSSYMYYFIYHLHNCTYRLSRKPTFEKAK